MLSWWFTNVGIIMQESLQPIYREIQDRLVKIAWTHKIQEIQAGLYVEESNCNKWLMAIVNALTTTSAFVTVVTNALKAIDAAWIMPALTSLLAVVSTIITLRYKDDVLEDKAMMCKQYAAKCRHMRNQYEALLTDIKTGRLLDVETISLKRDLMTELENELFAGELAPHTTKKAVTKATRALKINQESLTTEEEIKAIVPQHLQEV